MIARVSIFPLTKVTLINFFNYLYTNNQPVMTKADFTFSPEGLYRAGNKIWLIEEPVPAICV